jgi:uncharacterized protein (DUF4415 family)
MPKLKPGTIRPTPEEDAAITAAALSDRDNPPLPDIFFVEARRLGAGRPLSARTKTSISLRLDPEVLEFYKSAGKGWQSRIGEILAEYSRTHKG